MKIDEIAVIVEEIEWLGKRIVRNEKRLNGMSLDFMYERECVKWLS